MIYKGFTGSIEFDKDAGIYFGRVIGIRDVVTFTGKTHEDATTAFHDSIDDYLEFCSITQI